LGSQLRRAANAAGEQFEPRLRPQAPTCALPHATRRCSS
jgi:hypothetical protein